MNFHRILLPYGVCKQLLSYEILFFSVNYWSINSPLVSVGIDIVPMMPNTHSVSRKIITQNIDKCRSQWIRNGTATIPNFPISWIFPTAVGRTVTGNNSAIYIHATALSGAAMKRPKAVMKVT